MQFFSARRIVSPFFGQVQLGVQQAIESRRGIGQHGSGKGVHIAHWDAKGRFVGQAVHTTDSSVNKGRRILLNKAGNLAITGMVGSGGRGTALQNGGKITDVSPSADFYLVKTQI